MNSKDTFVSGVKVHHGGGGWWLVTKKVASDNSDGLNMVKQWLLFKMHVLFGIWKF